MDNMTLLTDVLIVVIPILTKFIVDYIQNIRTTTLLSQALEIVKAGVAYTSQTFVDSLKKEGKFDAEAQKKAFRKAFYIIEPMFNDAMKKLITTAYGDFEEWLKVQIEVAVKENKKA